MKYKITKIEPNHINVGVTVKYGQGYKEEHQFTFTKTEMTSDEYLDIIESSLKQRIKAMNTEYNVDPKILNKVREIKEV